MECGRRGENAPGHEEGFAMTAAVARHFFEEVESIQVNEADSNMIVIRKKSPVKWENWQITEADK